MKKLLHKKPSEITPYFRNPRKNDDAVPGVAESIKAFGFQAPILCDENFEIIAGHTRWKAALKLELDKVPVVITDELSDVKKRAYRIADNKYGERAEWDFAFLKDELEDLDTGEFDLEITGFDMSEIEELMTKFGDEYQGQTDDDAIPEDVEAICKSGDLWQLGKHRLLCGDATSDLDVGILMDGKKASVCITSPPYWVGKDYEVQKNEKEINDFIENAVWTLSQYIYSDNSRIIINTGTGMATRIGEKRSRVILLIDKWINSFYKRGWYLRHIRQGGGTGTPIAAKTDYVYSGMEYLLTFYNINGIQRGQNKLSEQWCQQPDWNDIKGDKQMNEAGFPIEIPRRFIELYSIKDESIIDCFMGNGTTLIACEKTNRICYGMEIDPHYCDVIIKRWEDYTGGKAEKINGK